MSEITLRLNFRIKGGPNVAISYNNLVAEFTDFISKYGNAYSNYYIGITNDVDRRLFGEHNVDIKNGKWIYGEADSDMDARRVEEHFLNKGCDGGTGGGDTNSTVVYCYKKTSNTKE